MPTVLTHPAVPLAIGMAFGRKTISAPLLAGGVIGSMLPDLDVIAFRLGIPYAAEFGHRGFSHSLLFAFLAALLGACLSRRSRSTFPISFLFLFLAVGSHGLLDTLTNGGLGIALFWPWSAHRYFLPVQPIEVAPLGLARFLSDRGMVVLRSELIWVWAPATGVAMTMFIARRALALRRAAATPGEPLPADPSRTSSPQQH